MLAVGTHNDSRQHRLRLLLFPVAAVAVFATMYVLYSGLSTIHELDSIEAQRDTWQRPSDVIGALKIHEGSVVADLGSGAGYFTLKLSKVVGSSGNVLAVDLRKLSLSFLWIRAAFRPPHNIQIIAGDVDDPHLPAQAIDAVLIANTYHEFQNPGLMLDHVFRSLRADGRLVILDRNPSDDDSASIGYPHGTTMDSTVDALSQHGFNVTTRLAGFIDRPGEDHWWLAVGIKNSRPPRE